MAVKSANQETKLKTFNSNVKSVLLYGSDLASQHSIEQRVQSYVNRCLRKIMSVRWPDVISHLLGPHLLFTHPLQFIFHSYAIICHYITCSVKKLPLTKVGNKQPSSTEMLSTYTTHMLKNIFLVWQMTLHCYIKYLFILTCSMSTLQRNAFNTFSLIIKTVSCSLLKMLTINIITLGTVTVTGRTIFLDINFYEVSVTTLYFHHETNMI
jgi:hypothetical protein